MAKTPKEAKAVMGLVAAYCNAVDFSLSNNGLRLTFAETCILAGEPPTQRCAVFIPISAVEPFINGLEQVKRDYAIKNAPKIKAL